MLTAEQVAGVNDTFPLTFIFLQFAFGCTAGFSVITANCVGSRDARGVRRSFAAQIELSLVISAFLTVLSILLLPQMLALINVTPAHGEVYTTARTYCLIIFIGTVAQIGYNLICGILRAFGDSFTPLLFLTISTLLNVGVPPVRRSPPSRRSCSASSAARSTRCANTRRSAPSVRTGAYRCPRSRRISSRACRSACSFPSLRSASS